MINEMIDTIRSLRATDHPMLESKVTQFRLELKLQADQLNREFYDLGEISAVKYINKLEALVNNLKEAYYD